MRPFFLLVLGLVLSSTIAYSGGKTYQVSEETLKKLEVNLNLQIKLLSEVRQELSQSRNQLETALQDLIKLDQDLTESRTLQRTASESLAKLENQKFGDLILYTAVGICGGIIIGGGLTLMLMRSP